MSLIGNLFSVKVKPVCELKMFGVGERSARIVMLGPAAKAHLERLVDSVLHSIEFFSKTSFRSTPFEKKLMEFGVIDMRSS